MTHYLFIIDSLFSHTYAQRSLKCVLLNVGCILLCKCEIEAPNNSMFTNNVLYNKCAEYEGAKRLRNIKIIYTYIR